MVTRLNLSHPSRVRGLKFIENSQSHSHSGSHPSRVRGLKYCHGLKLFKILKSHPSRVRGLKYISKDLKEVAKQSHPSRVRGLKYIFRVWKLYAYNVAPFTGAWIEIRHQGGDVISLVGRTLHGCVDWNHYGLEHGIPSVASYPSRVRGLKFSTLYQIQKA